MLLRLITLLILVCPIVGCVNLKPREDTRKEYTLGLINLPSVQPDQEVERGYIARPYFPAYMEGYGLKVRSADGELIEVEGARWAEPIDLGVARSLSHYIEVASGGLKSGFYPWPQSNFEDNVLHLRFHQLIATAEGRILLSASWELKQEGRESRSGVFTFTESTWNQGDPQSMVTGFNVALEAFANEIWASLKKR
ncbi:MULTISPECIES: membrane integrity-associated transporter subunit PqiC [unclassified Lentimonas]|uniref:PqiC family protein n=1 Tax=unclassified Lentimonas TaxID=2630993 RepID=UPI00132A09AB|nr:MULTISPECIES: ABC-type transport auxiliary lipoprotein family protein [unclassified Lentimonas]CAA6689727.1 Unannotated [Lentimonas sp. CC19]CAA6690490.1 Unannotated [Lentimonas sp. CC10]CAA7068748.1 Unannotated [Lentimonas sp. CC11]